MNSKFDFEQAFFTLCADLTTSEIRSDALDIIADALEDAGVEVPERYSLDVVAVQLSLARPGTELSDGRSLHEVVIDE